MELGYTLDIKAKQITFTVKQEELDETAKELGDNVTASEVEQAINSVLTNIQLQLWTEPSLHLPSGIMGTR